MKQIILFCLQMGTVCLLFATQRSPFLMRFAIKINGSNTAFFKFFVIDHAKAVLDVLRDKDPC